jgi:hypothetical protein
VDTPDEQDAALTFSRFMLSLATTAAVHFGDLPDPTTDERGEPNLPAARQMIELIELLQKKTQGNLTPEEARLIDDLLYDLRLRFVQAQQDDRRIVEP